MHRLLAGMQEDELTCVEAIYGDDALVNRDDRCVEVRTLTEKIRTARHKHNTLWSACLGVPDVSWSPLIAC